MTGGNSSAGVAIVGIACRFPGAADHSAFWRNLCEGVESISELSDQDLLSAGVPGELLRNPSYVKAASLLPDIDQFDAAFFEYSPEEARLMDPQQRLLLEVAWEAFEDAGQRVGHSSQPIGVFTGLGGAVSSYLVDRLPFSADLPGFTGSLAHLGNDKDFPSTRISYKLDLTGPSVNVQTACSTSLVAVHLGYGDWNDCPSPAVHAAFARCWSKAYGAAPAALAGDVIEYRVARPVGTREEAMELALAQFAYCPDIVLQGTETLEHLAAELLGARYWFFWWD